MGLVPPERLVLALQTVEASGYAILAILLAVATVLVVRRRAV